MPKEFLKNLQKKTGLSMKTLEDKYDKAKSIASEMGQKDNYKFITGTLHSMLDIKEKFSMKKYKPLFELVMSSSLAAFTPSDNPIAVRTPGGHPDKKLKLKPKASDYQKNYDIGNLKQTDAEKNSIGMFKGKKMMGDKPTVDRADKTRDKVIKDLGDDIDAKKIEPTKESRNIHGDMIDYFTEIESGDIAADVPENVLDITTFGMKNKKKKKKKKDEEENK